MENYMFNLLGSNNNSKKQKKKINKKKVFKVITITICIALCITLMILYNNNPKFREIMDKYIFRKEVYENNLPKIEIDSSKNIDVYAYNKYITILEQNKLKLYNSVGREEGSLDIEISTPLFEANGEYLVIAEKNGQKIYLINDKNIIWQANLDGKISGVSVNKNGYVSVIISGTSYKTVIKNFDTKGKEIFTNYLATSNVIDTDISNDNKYLAIAEVNFSGIVVQSTIKVISIEDAKNNASESIKYSYVAEADDLIIKVKYQNKNQLICMYDKHIDVLEDGQNVELINIENEDVLFSDINLSSKIVKIVKKPTESFKTEAEMQIIDSDNKNINIFNIENVPKEMYIQDDMILVNLGTSALFIKDSGWLVKKYESSHEIQNIVLCNEVAGIVSKNKIEIISL